MGRSRYAGNEVIDGHFTMWNHPAARDPLGPDILDGVETVDHVVVGTDRLDIIAHRYYGDEEYWWVIALANNITDPFSLTVGRKLRVPTEARAILDKISR